MKNRNASLLLAGLAAAYAWYRYSKMTPGQKKNIVHDLKQKGRDIWSELGSFVKSNGKEHHRYAGEDYGR